ncbi:MAG: DUF1080 domain-containing protein [Gemmataceae bacterium]|nr:DUF1080 domain-containing protein [Gemmataceae bacterium]
MCDPVQELFERWQAAYEQGQNPAVEELCRDRPELIDLLRLRIEAWMSTHGRMQATAAGEAPPARTSRWGFQAGTEPVPGYQLIAPLGRGAFGHVWKATGPGGFLVAMKLIPIDSRAEKLELRALELMKGIRHANLLALFGTWEDEDLLAVAMELADRTLMDRCNEARRAGLPGIPFDELIEYMQDAAKAIDFLNEPRHTLGDKTRVGVQHRDIKPQNLLLVGGSVKVADFGLAKLLEQTAASNSGSMTVSYAPPEFFRGQTSARSDQYALAVTYCQLRGGRLPFGGSIAEMTAGHLSMAPDLSFLPEEERPAVARALAKNPDERWSSCREFVKALAERRDSPAVATDTQHLSRVQILVPATPEAAALTQGSRPVGRRFRAGIVLGLLALLLLVGGRYVAMNFKAPFGEQGHSPNAPPTPQAQNVAKEEFQPLFNGKDLRGWLVDGGPTSDWKVTGDEVTAEGADWSGVNWLLTEKEYGNFVLQFQFRLSAGGDSGIALRAVPGERITVSTPDGDRLSQYKLEVQLLDEGSPRNKTDPTGGIFWSRKARTQLPDRAASLRPTGEWNEAEIELRDQWLRVSVNGRQIVDTTLNDLSQQEDALPGLRRRSGRIGLQKALGTVSFRSVKIKELPGPPSMPEEFRPLFNGKDLAGWSVSTGDPAAWKVESGALVVNGDRTGEFVVNGNLKNQGWLMTDRDYSDFVLRLEFQLSHGTNSGVTFRAAVGEGFKQPKQVAEIQLLDDSYAAYAQLPPNKKTGALYALAIDEPAELKQVGAWNTMQIELQGRSLRVTVNGKLVLKSHLDHFTNQAESIPGLKRIAGRIGLQNWDGTTRFRNIEIKELQPGFQPLFNGKDLTGWVVDCGDATRWKVEGGHLVASGVPSGVHAHQSWLLTREDWKDYALRLDFQLGEGVNSGIAIRALPGEGKFEQGIPPHLEVQLQDDSHPRYAKIPRTGKSGALYSLALDRVAPLRPNGEWNKLELELRGQYLKVVVNGEPVLQTNLNDFLNEAAKYPGLKRSSGRIGLQNWGTGPIRFRNVEVKDLSAAGFQSLFNGKDLTGFYTWLAAPAKGRQPLGKNRDPEKVFTVRDGMIHVTGRVYGYLATEKEYENYHLLVEYQWGKKTWPPREGRARNSGIFLHAVGEDGVAGAGWMESIECQLIEGGTGDLNLVKGKNQPKLTADVGERGGQYYYKPGGEPREFPPGRINWYGRSPDWKDELGYCGAGDVEKPVGEWNWLECICAGDQITVILNGKLVNRGTKSSLTKGKILLQSEGAEVFFRRVDLKPITSPEVRAYDDYPVGEVRQFLGHTGAIWSVDLSADRRLAISGAGGEYKDGKFSHNGTDNTARVWEVSTGKQLHRFTAHTDFVRHVAFSPDSRQAVTCSRDKTVRLWDIQTGKERHCLYGHTLAATGAAFIRNGAGFVSVGVDGTLRVWDTATGKGLHAFQLGIGELHSVAIPPGGREAFCGTRDRSVVLVDLTNGEVKRRYDGQTALVHEVACSPDGSQLLAGNADGKAVLWSVSDGKKLADLDGHAVRFSPDGKRMLIGCNDFTLRLLDTSDRRELRCFREHRSFIQGVAVSSDGRYGLSGGWDGTLRLWRVP